MFFAESVNNTSRLILVQLADSTASSGRGHRRPNGSNRFYAVTPRRWQSSGTSRWRHIYIDLWSDKASPQPPILNSATPLSEILPTKFTSESFSTPVHLSVISLSCCCYYGHTSDQKQCEDQKVYVGWGNHGGEGMMTGDRGWLVTFHPQSENRKRVEGVLGSHSPLYPVHVTPAQRMTLLPCVMSLPSLTQSRNFLTDVPRGLSPSQFEILLHWPSILKKNHTQQECVCVVFVW